MFAAPTIAALTPDAPARSFTEQIVRRNHVRVLGAGKDKPTLLLCHGFGCNQHIWGYLEEIGKINRYV